MPDRNMLAQLFLAGRSPEEQAARLARQHQQSGLGGGAFPPAPDPMITGASGPGGGAGGGGGGGFLPNTGPIPTPRPDPMVMQTPTSAPSDLAPVIPTPRPSPMMPPDPMAASAPTNATLPFVPGSSRMPPDLGVSPLMPPDPMAASAPTNNPPPPMEIAPSPVRPRDPMQASAPTEIGAYEAQRQFGLPRSKPKTDRKKQTADAQSKFRKRTYGLGS